MSSFNLLSICALGRSGSTMLDLMLGNANNAFSCGEVYARFRPWRPHHRESKCSCGDNNCAVWNKLENSDEKSFYRNLAETQNVSYIIDSSKELSWFIDSSRYAIKTGGKVQVILLWKHPKTLAHSYWKRGLSYKKMRKDFLEYYGRYLSLDIPYVSVSYENLIADTPKILKKLCEVTGLEYFEGKEEFWKKQYHHLYGSAGTRQQLQREEGAIRAEKVMPQKFMQEYEIIEGKIKEDKDIQNLIAKLMENDVIKESGNKSSFIEHINFRRTPSWYYMRRFIFLLRRVFPDKSLEVQKNVQQTKEK
jgi:hypothetical protein